MRGCGDGARLGKTYWRNLRAESGLDTRLVELDVVDLNEHIGQDLFDALVQATIADSKERDVSSLTALLAHRTELRQRELVGIVRALVELGKTQYVSGGALAQL